MTGIDFWFEFGSTYSYPSAMRIGNIAQAVGAEVRWRPFLLGPIFADQGWNDSPFNLYPAKGRYMWRDMERLCEGYGLPFARPSQFPRNSLLAARICCVGADEAWMPNFVRATYTANFARDRDIADPNVLCGILDSLGQSGDAIVREAGDAAVKQRLRNDTDCARELGIFGAPSFTVGKELFWGDDRLGAAIACAATGGLG